MQRVASRHPAKAMNQVKSELKGLLFVSPWVIGLLAFTIYPILSSLYYSMTRYDVIRKPAFIGLANYVALLTEDVRFRVVLGNTLYFVVVGVPLGLVTAFLLATLLNANVRLRPLYRTIFFIPSIVPVVASAMVWLWVFNTQHGVINSMIIARGLAAIPFLSSPILAKPSLILVRCWSQGGAMVIFLAALQDVPRSLYDAALVDGAARLQRFWHITIPMCTPALLFVLVTALIDAFQTFTFAYLLTNGGPVDSTEFYGLYLYHNAFKFFKMGYASALAWILFVVIVIFTILVFKTSARWVYYGGATE